MDGPLLFFINYSTLRLVLHIHYCNSSYNYTYNNTSKIKLVIKLVESGLIINGLKITLSMYADVAILLAESPTQLQHMINALYEYVKNWHQSVNVDISKIMIFKVSESQERKDGSTMVSR